jgi:hypothetical protein
MEKVPLFDSDDQFDSDYRPVDPKYTKDDDPGLVRQLERWFRALLATGNFQSMNGGTPQFAESGSPTQSRRCTATIRIKGRPRRNVSDGTFRSRPAEMVICEVH